MQQNILITNQNVHIKVQFQEEFRRFSVTSYDILEPTIRQLFSIPICSQLQMRYLDDEQDWVTLTNNIEFDYACELFPTYLRLSVSLKEGSIQPKDEVKDDNITTRGVGRGAHHFRQERLDMKISNLTERIHNLEEKTKKEGLPKDRARILAWRLQNLQEKLEALTDSFPKNVGDQEHFQGRKRGGRCGRFRNNDKENNLDESNPDSFTHCKTRFTVRKYENRDQDCHKDFKAKYERRNQFTPEKRQLLQEKRASINQCKSNLTLARQEGRKDEIPALINALKQAKYAFHETKLSN